MKRRASRRLVLVIALHHRVAAQHDLALGFAVARDKLACLGVHHRRALMHREGHALAALQVGKRVEFEIVPFLAPNTLGDMAIGFGQAVDMRHLEIHLGHLLQDGCRRRGAGSEGLDLVVELRMHLFRRVHQQAENDGRAAEMRHPVGVDGAEDVRRADLADQHQRAGHHRHRPGMAPAVAVEHRHDIEICRMLRQRPASGGPHAHQICAAMVIDHALGAARGAGGVAKRQRLPLVGRHLPVIVRVACPDEALVILVADRRQITHRRIADIDHADVLANVGGQRFQRGHHGRGKGGVDDQHAAVAVLEDIGDGLRLEPCIDGVQHTTRHRHTEMRLEHLGRVGGNHRHRVANAEPGPG